MPKLQISFKRLAIDKATKTILGSLVLTAAVAVFALVASRALFMQLQYQNKVIGAKKTALKQLKSNINAVNSLVGAYKAFDESAESIIGTPDKNSKIVLDALPSKYDFPALATSLEKILSGYEIESISGNDDEVAQQSAAGSTVVEIPFLVGVTTNFASIQKLIEDFDRSIRPLHILSLELSGSDDSMKMDITAKTYYQSEKTLEIKTQELQ